MRLILFSCVFFIITGCNYKKSLLNKINGVWYNNGEKYKAGKYVLDNRKSVFKMINKSRLKNNNIVLVENVLYLQDYYSCAIFSDSLIYYFKAKGLEKPHEISLNEIKSSDLSIYIYDHIRKGNLKNILSQGANRFYTHPSSILITLVESDRTNLNIKGYDIYEFIPEEKLKLIQGLERN